MQGAGTVTGSHVLPLMRLNMVRAVCSDMELGHQNGHHQKKLNIFLFGGTGGSRGAGSAGSFNSGGNGLTSMISWLSVSVTIMKALLWPAARRAFSISSKSGFVRSRT